MQSLPDELIVSVASYLSVHDVTKLVRTCRRLDKLITPLLWDRIELHPRRYHFLTDLENPAPAIPEKKRAYLRNEGDLLDAEPELLFLALHQTAIENRGRLKLLCGRIRSICTMVSSSCYEALEDDVPSIWYVLANFVNLEELEIYGQCHYWEGVPMISKFHSPPLPNLRYAKLFGYIPKEFVIWVLSARTTLQRLELGLLDRPISSNCQGSDKVFAPLPSENLLIGEQDDEQDLYEGSDNGSLDGELVVPRPLTRFIVEKSTTHPTTGATEFQALEHLSLSQPSRSNYGDNFKEYSWSTRAEAACLTDWRQLLLMSSRTLEVLVLEQRPAAEQIELDAYASSDYVKKNSEGVGSETLVQMVIDLVETEGSLPRLKKVYLYGIAVGPERITSTAEGLNEGVPGRQLMACLKEHGIACEARLGIWCLFQGDSGVVNLNEDFPDEDARVERSTLLATT